MYPDQVKLHNADRVTLSISRGFDESKLERAEIMVAIEPYASSGDLQLMFQAGHNNAEIIIGPDEALTLADALTFYANASKRIEAKHPQGERQHSAFGTWPSPPPDGWTPEWSGHGDC